MRRFNVGWTSPSSSSATGTTTTGTGLGSTFGDLAVGQVLAVPTKLAVTSVSPASPTAGAPFSVTVQVQTASGSPINVTSTTGIHLALTAGTSTLSGLPGSDPTIAIGSNSVTFTGLSYTKAESITLTASSSSGMSLTSATSTFAVQPAAAAAAVYTTQPSNTTGGVSPTPAVKVELRDAFGNVTSSTATVTLAITSGTGTPGATITGNSVAAVNGVATFSNLTIDKAGLGYTLDASSAGVPTVTSSAFDVAVGPAAKLVFTQQPTAAVAGVQIAPAITVQVQDAGGNDVSTSIPVSIAIGTNPSGGVLSGTTPVTSVSGLAVFSDLTIDKAGTGYTLVASSSGLASGTSSGFDITAAAADHLTFGQQPTNTAAGSSITPSVTVQVRDQFGNVVTGDSSTQVTLDLGANPGSSTFSGTLTQTAVNGVATFPGLSLNKTGTGYTLTAVSTPALTGATSNTFNITPGAANKLVFGVQPSTENGGSAITPAVTVRILDANDNLTTSTANVTIAIGNNPVGGTLSGTTTVAASGGTATFSNLIVNKAGLGYTLAASSGSLAGATSDPFDIVVGPAAKLAFLQPPTNNVAGVAISPAVTVQVQDLGGNLVADSTASIAMAIGTNPGAATLSGTTPVDAVAGVATFSDLSINKAGNGYTLVASSSGLTSGTSATFNITAAAADKLAFTTSPGASNTAGTNFGTQPVVTVQDAFGNTVTGDTSNVALSITSGTGAPGAILTCTANPKAAVAGVAAFAGCRIDLVGTGYTLTATDGSLTAATSAAFNVNAGTAVSGDGSMSVAPTSVVAGSAGNSLAFTFTAPAARDFSNGSYVTITVPTGWAAPTTGTTSINAGTCGGTVTRTTASQVVTVTMGSGCAHGNSFTLTYSPANAPNSSATSGTFNVASHAGSGGTATALTPPSVGVTILPGPATNLNFLQQPMTTAAGAAISPAVTVRIRDAFNNVVTSDNTTQVTLAITSGSGTAGAVLSGTTTKSGRQRRRDLQTTSPSTRPARATR